MTIIPSAKPAGDSELQPETAEVLPVLRGAAAPAVEADRDAALPGFGRDLVRTVAGAGRAVARVEESGEHDVAVGALTAVQCLSATVPGALRAAAEFLRAAPEMELHGLLWARVPDVDGQWEQRLTVLVSAVDPVLGEAAGATHHAEPRECRTAVYVNREGGAGRALAAVERSGLSQDGALEAAAEFLGRVPAMALDGLLWARVPGRVPSFRLTVLVSGDRATVGGSAA
ncbi:hypothetical protein AB0C76_32965 [Kitasatospora sp. NPDC048722]|uniref:hypothetical protein n=1 Tax=Kitasatospora sp. NPDC048722 TaxID=3155639 RepID=UPI0033D7FFD5